MTLSPEGILLEGITFEGRIWPPGLPQPDRFGAHEEVLEDRKGGGGGAKGFS